MTKENTPNPRFDDSDTSRRPNKRLIEMGGFTTLLGKTDAEITGDSTGTVSIWEGELGSETDTGKNKTAYNRGDTIDSGIWVNLIRRGGGWEMFPLECNA